MTSRVIILLIWALALYPGPASGSGPLHIGKAAPDFTLPTLDGKASLSLRDFRGQVVLVDFWASWCAPCKRSLPHLAGIENEFGGVKVVTVSVDDIRENGVEFLRRNRVKVTALHDRDKTVAKRFNIPAMPSAVIIDREGIIRYVHSGYVEEDIESMKKQLRELL